jgi:hypothetical protein
VRERAVRFEAAAFFETGNAPFFEAAPFFGEVPFFEATAPFF